MVTVQLLFGIVALACGQKIIYPDEYLKMSVDFDQVSVPADYSPLQAAAPSASYQSVQNDQPTNDRSAVQFNIAERQFYSTTPHEPLMPAASPTASPQPMPETWNDRVNNIISRGVTKFALDLDRTLYKTSGTSTSRRENTIFSPLSISVALSLVLLGSAGKTFDEVTRILGLETGVDISQHSEIVHQMFGQLLAVMNRRVEGSNMPRLSSASGIFVQEGYPIRPEFKSISERAYNSEVINLDFRTKSRQARDTINAWVKQRTMEKIDSILNENPDALTTVILLTALYFKGEWNQHFMKTMTRKKQFFIEPNDTVEVDMMYNGGGFSFYEDKEMGVKIVALPYKGLETSMYVLLPNAEGAAALKNFQDHLTPEKIQYLIDNTKNETCIIGLPRMKLSSTLNLNNVLNHLGLHTLFDPKTADLSLLSNGFGQGSQVPIASVSQPQAAPISQTLPTFIPQASSPVPRQVPTDELIFSRLGNTEDEKSGVKKNYFTYDDKKRGITVEQWDSGFNIRTIGRTRRNARSKRQHNATKSSRATYVMGNDNILNTEKATLKVNDAITKYVSLEENKYRFQNVREKSNRRKRQSRPIDENFLRYLKTQNLPFYGVDNLRNSANLVNPGLYATEILHKVFMDVTETGTEAAATTAVLLRRDGNQKKLIANRPFMFFIRHDPTKLVLFWGTVNVPTPSSTVVR
ncbi:hypothetical protein PUN28_006670 [Cardiocondyla obscurior]|uniref:Serpin domain-containing protein n=2 Tax=Cardiocondyla obscurior TaxID=286306 RepID=A0AAW2GBF1_9HYME